MAVAEASFKISMDSISLGLILLKGLLLPAVHWLPLPGLTPAFTMGKPSTTYSGSFPAPVEAAPRIRTSIPPPGCALPCFTVSPAARPINISEKFGEAALLSFSDFTETIEAFKSLFFIVPYPTTTTSSSNSCFSYKTMDKSVWFPTFTSRGW